jgi:hypothetical protein
VRRGIHITTTTDVAYELEARGRPGDGTATAGGTGLNGTEHKSMNDGLFLQSDSGSITGVSRLDGDAEDFDALDNLQKLGDEEAVCPPAIATLQHVEFPAPPAAVQPHTQSQVQVHPNMGSDASIVPNQRHSYVNVSSPANTAAWTQ